MIITATTFVVYLSYGLYISQYNPSVLPDELRTTSSPYYHDYKGVTHAQTSLSTGSLPAEDVIRDAAQAGLDFLFLTDLDNFKPHMGPIGYYEHLLAFDAGEYSYLDSRLLYYDDQPSHQIRSIGQSQMLFADLLSQRRQHRNEGLVVLAHPFLRGFEWSGQYPPGLGGIEILNLKRILEHAWNRSKISFLWSGLIYPFNPKLALLRLYFRPDKELDLYDKLTRTHPLVALAGNNSTARAINLGPWIWRFPSYQTSFEILSNHILLRSELTSDPAHDSKRILNALKEGHSYACVDLLGDPTGFYADMREGRNHFPMGSQISWKSDLKLAVILPRRPKVPFEVVVFKNGTPYLRSRALKTFVKVPSAGVYRVSVRVTPRLPLPDGQRTFTWIYTNAFYVHGTRPE